MKKKRHSSLREQLLLVVLAPLLIVLLPIILIVYFTASLLLHISVWLLWNSRGIKVLYVYSNSPNWQNHIEEQILPRLPEKRIILNWSERKHWKHQTLASMVFRHFGGDREFNPMAVVIKPLRRAIVFRFYNAFGDFKHGKISELQEMEAEFFRMLKT